MQTQQTDLTDRIERMPQLEQKAGVKLTGLFATATEDEDYDDDGRTVPTGKYKVMVNGEVETRSGGSLEQSLDLVITLHDEHGRVLAKLDEHMDAEEFFALKPFSCTEYDMRTVPAKVRIYPQTSA